VTIVNQQPAPVVAERPPVQFSVAKPHAVKAVTKTVGTKAAVKVIPGATKTITKTVTKAVTKTVPKKA
jgi:hypothetical protein